HRSRGPATPPLRCGLRSAASPEPMDRSPARRLGAAGAGLFGVGLATSVALAAAVATWSLTVSPLIVHAGVTTTFHLRAENLVDDVSSEIYCIVVDVPKTAKVESASVTGTDTATSWTATTSNSGGSGSRVILTPTDSAGHIHQGQWVTADVIAQPKSTGVS